MHKCLYLLCPTDCLESVINEKYKNENYFYTSLGNSFAYDNDTIKHIKDTVYKNNIRNIYFILSIDNQIILDALGRQDFSHIRRLSSFYDEINHQKKYVKMSWRKGNIQFSVLSYYLNKKIKELNAVLNLSSNPIKIYGKIYNRHYDIFSNIYSGLIYLEKHHLN